SADAAAEFKPILSAHGTLTPLSATNRLEATDSVINLLELRHLLQQEQKDVGEQDFRFFKLEHTRAEDVRELLAELLGLPAGRRSSGSGGSMSPGGMQAMQQMMQAQQKMQQQAQQKMQQQMQAMAQASKAAGKSGSPPRMRSPGKVALVVNERENGILAYAPPDKMAMIDKAISAIDVPTDSAHSLLRNKDRMQVYRLESLSPQSLIAMLEKLGELDFDTRLETDVPNNAIIAYASLADHLTIHALIEKLEGGGRQAEVIQLVKLRAATVAKTIDFMMGGGRKEEGDQNTSRRRSYFSPYGGYYDGGYSSRRGGGSDDYADKFRIDADAKNNRLLLWCNEFEAAKVENLLSHLREMPETQRTANSPKVYHLSTIDPESFVKSLEGMETLDFYTKLEVDKENNAIIAFASADDHAKITELIATLDGSSREFHVISLRRLEADYVSGTISFMMAGKDDSKSSGYNRTYVYNDYYGDYSGSRGGKKSDDEFRVDADVEFNRLLLWANEVEIEEVRNLLV
ncbi:MAG: hypothetical protein GY720_14410, partial [bacterium]|nr:hypothetical protein [bacterium]